MTRQGLKGKVRGLLEEAAVIPARKDSQRAIKHKVSEYSSKVQKISDHSYAYSSVTLDVNISRLDADNVANVTSFHLLVCGDGISA